MSETPTKETVQEIDLVLGEDCEVTVTKNWFPSRTEYSLGRVAYAPLINGEAIFGALEKAIANAEKSVEYITWGFQSSMIFTRKQNGGGKSIAQILIEAAERGVQVRVLVWFSFTADFSTPNFPGHGAYYPSQRNDKISGGNFKLDYQTDEQYDQDKKFYADIRRGKYPNIQIYHRDFNSAIDPGIEDIANRIKPFDIIGPRPDEKILGIFIKDGARKEALNLYTTHHQKTVLIDIEDPNRAVGFVMGHNTLSEYWDTDEHSIIKKSFDKGRDGPTSFQDISSCVYGDVLKDIYQNFIDSWTIDVGDKDPNLDEFLQKKEKIFNLDFDPKKQISRIEKDLGIVLSPAQGQICRTQSQIYVSDILTAYRHAIKESSNYIYIENQYFRLPALLKELRSHAEERAKATDYTKPIYLFVITNNTEKPEDPSWTSNQDGGLQTLLTLEALGRPDTFPVYTRKKRGLKKDAIIVPEEIPGLQIVICTLVASGYEQVDKENNYSPWMPTYVHSKLMMIDDDFLIQGSANINARSMAFDSELTISIQDTCEAPIVQPMRKKLWQMHTGRAPLTDIAEEFRKWVDTSYKNLVNRDNNKLPNSPLIAFQDRSETLTNND